LVRGSPFVLFRCASRLYVTTRTGSPIEVRTKFGTVLEWLNAKHGGVPTYLSYRLDLPHILKFAP